MGRGALKVRRSKNDRRRKTKMRRKRQAEAKGTARKGTA